MNQANASVALFGKCQAGWTVLVVNTGRCPFVVLSTSAGLLGWYLLHVPATVLGGTLILWAMDVPSWLRNLCRWQIQPHVTSCSMGCPANRLSFHHTSRISSFSRSDWSGDTPMMHSFFHYVTKKHKHISYIRHHFVLFVCAWSPLLTFNSSSRMPKSQLLMHW